MWAALDSTFSDLDITWYLRRWSMNVEQGYLSPPMATPSYTPLVWCDMMLFNSFDIPPERETYATAPGLYSLLCRMLSIMPPVLPILKQPGVIPPTVAGPMIVTFFFSANLINFRVRF